MNEEKTTANAALEDESQASKEGKKRISYVSKDLQTMIDFFGKVYNQLGHTDFLSNKAIAAVHSLSSDTIKLHLSSAQQYKILELKHGTGYKITEHFQKLFLPRNESEKRSAVIESLKTPETYQQLFKDYEYHVVPLDGVKNYFIRSYGMKEDVAMKAAQVFIDNLKQFELLDSRGVLISALPSKPIIPEVKTDPDEQNKDTTNGSSNGEGTLNDVPTRNRVDKLIFQSELDAAGKKTIPIYLIGNKQALFVYPDDITEDDIELVKHQIDGVLLRIKLESKKRSQESTEEK